MNIILYFKRAYYLKMVCEEKISKEDVATIYSTSVENVEKAVKDYKNKKNPLRLTDSRTRHETIQTLISFLSIVLVLLTLFEMQAERNAAYYPNIAFDSQWSGVKFAWDKNHTILDDSQLEEQQRKQLETWHDSAKRDFFVDARVQNTGVGMAKEAYINWHLKENISAVQEIFSNISDISFTVYTHDIVVETKYEDPFGVSTIGHDSEYLGFIATDINEYKHVYIPPLYTKLYEIACSYDLWRDFPNYRFTVEYKDVQGKEYKKTYTIQYRNPFIREEEDGSGVALTNFVIIEDENNPFDSGFLSEIIKNWSLIIGAIILIIGFLFSIDYISRMRRVEHDSKTEESE